MSYATTNNLIRADQSAVRASIIKRFSPLDGIGADLSDTMSYSEALKLSGLGFETQRESLQTPSGKQIVKFKALFNSNTGEQLSVVKDEYTVISNEEAFSTAEDLVAYEGFKYETSNMQRNGARSRLILSGNNVDIGGEEYTPYAIFNNSFDTSKSLCVQFMFMRLACLNGMMRKAPGCSSTIALTHFGQKESKLKRLTKFRSQFSETLNYLKKEAQVLQQTPLTREEFKNEIIPAVVAHTFSRPINQQLTAQQQARTEAYVTSILSAYDQIDTTNFDGTAYKVQLALSDIDSHLAPFANRGRPDVYFDRILQNGTALSTANFATNYIIQRNRLHI